MLMSDIKNKVEAEGDSSAGGEDTGRNTKERTSDYEGLAHGKMAQAAPCEGV